MYNVYYRVPNEDKKPKLRCVAVDIDDHEDAGETVKKAKQLVLEQLCHDMEVFFKPVLVLIKGGKH